MLVNVMIYSGQTVQNRCDNKLTSVEITADFIDTRQ